MFLLYILSCCVFNTVGAYTVSFPVFNTVCTAVVYLLYILSCHVYTIGHTGEWVLIWHIHLPPFFIDCLCLLFTLSSI